MTNPGKDIFNKRRIARKNLPALTLDIDNKDSFKTRPVHLSTCESCANCYQCSCVNGIRVDTYTKICEQCEVDICSNCGYAERECCTCYSECRDCGDCACKNNAYICECGYCHHCDCECAKEDMAN